MSTFNSIRIYIPQGNIIESGFYDVIGYFGPNITINAGYYTIDISRNTPLIKSGDEYYNLNYDSNDGFTVSALTLSDYDNNKVHPLVSSTQMMIYQDRVGDFNGIGYDNPLNQNISISNISSYKIAYRAYHMEIFSDYAIRTLDGTIHDDYNIIDNTSDDIVLVETNTDNYVFTPTGGVVEYLYNFTVDCGKSIDRVLQKIEQSGRDVDICVYEKNTKSIVSHINASTLTSSGTSFSFNLQNRITSSGTYFLYLPSKIIEFVNGTKSPFTLIGYKINKSDETDDIQSYRYTPTSGKVLNKVRIQFPNMGTYNIQIDSTKVIGVYDNNDNSISPPSGGSYISGSCLTVINSNTVELDLNRTITNSGNTTLIYKINIPAETFRLSSSDYSSEVQITFNLIPESQELPVDNNLIVIFEPSNNSKIFKFDKFKIQFCLDEYLENSVSISTNSNKRITISRSGSSVTTVGFSNCTDFIEYKNGYKIFSFEFTLSSQITTPGSYSVSVPSEMFYINSSINSAYTCNYTLIKLNEESNVNKYCYEMIQIVPTSNNVINHDNGIDLSFKENNTIFINVSKMSDILFSPVVSIIDQVNNKTENVSYYNPLLNENDSLEMDATISVQLGSGIWKTETAIYNSQSSSNTNGFLYGLNISNSRQSYKLLNFSLGAQETSGLFFKNYRLGEIPRSMDLIICIKLNGISVQTKINIQILDDEVYRKYLQNRNWIIEKRIDIYSGEECEHVYTVPYPTESYDSLVKSVVTDNQGNPRERYEIQLESTTKVRLGNLDGIYNETLGKKQPFGYGLYGQNVFLTGNFFLNNGRSLLDVDDDITMAVGDINNIQNNLETLENRLDENSKLLDRKISDAEKGVSSTISNYISTNKDAIFKLGLDYSMWSLGSAGISIYNPNVRYKTDANGNRIVDETSVGDLDEGILIQADRLKINNYYSITKKESGQDVVYYKILATSVNPKDWVYEGNQLFFPKPNNFTVNSNREIKFYYYYVKQSDFSKYSEIDSTLGCEQALRYVYVGESTSGEPYCLTTINGVENYTAYAFNSFYKSKNGLALYKLNSNNELINAGVSDQIWFIPYVTQSAMFHNGKIYAKYIETEGLEVEYLIAISKKYSINNITKYIDVDYEKSNTFDITKEINEINYPVVKQSGYDIDGNIIYQNDYDAPFVVVSGNTGTITASSAEISGNITIGNEYSGNTYLKLYKGDDSTAPGMYIYNKNQDSDTFNEVASFGGWKNDDPLSRFKSGGNGNISIISTPTSSKSISVTTSMNGSSNPYNGPQYQNDHIIGYATNYTSDSYTSSNTIVIPNDGNSVYLTGRIYFDNSYPSLSHSVPECHSSAYASSQVYLQKHGTNERRFIKSYSYQFSKNRGSSGYYSNNYNSDVSNMTFSVEIPANFSDGSNFVLDLYVNTTVSLTIEPTNYSSTSGTATYNTGVLNISGHYDTQRYHSSFFGNGLTIGYNSQNYFGSYFKDSRMVFDFQSNGSGMCFDDGKTYYNSFGRKIPMGIPILEGVIHAYSVETNEGNDYHLTGRSYKFKGISLCNPSYATYGLIKLAKTFSVIGFTNDEDNLEGTNEGYAKKRLYKDSNSSDKSHVFVTKLKDHDLYLAETTKGGITIIFGKSWEIILNKETFGSNLFVQVTSIGPQDTYGPFFTTVQYISKGQNIGYEDSDIGWTSGTSQCTIDGDICKNFMCIVCADDFTLNSGAFYITVSYFPFETSYDLKNLDAMTTETISYDS